MLFSPVLCRDENSAHVRFLLAQRLTSAATLVAITHFKWTPPFAFGLKTYIFLPCSQAKALGHYLKRAQQWTCNGQFWWVPNKKVRADGSSYGAPRQLRDRSMAS